MKATITIRNNIRAQIEGDFDDRALDDHLAFHTSKFWWKSPRAKMGMWDGKTHLFNRASGLFPLGLKPMIVKWLKKNDTPYKVIDSRGDEGKLVAGTLAKELGGDITLRPDQIEAVEKVLRHERGIIHGSTGCLAGDTIVEINRAGKSFKMPLADVVSRFNGGPTRRFWRDRPMSVKRGCAVRWNPVIDTKIRYRDKDGYIRLTTLVDAYASGVKETFTLTTSDGHSVRATADHRFMTPGGWRRLDHLKVGEQIIVLAEPPRASKKYEKQYYHVTGGLTYHPNAGRRNVRSGWSVPTHRLVVEAALNSLSLSSYIKKLKTGKTRGLKYLPTEAVVHHIDGNHRNNSLANLEIVQSLSEHSSKHGKEGGWRRVTQSTRPSTVASIDRYGTEPTFDLEVEAHEHSFVANGVVVHNCGKTELAAAIIKTYGVPVTLFLTGRKKLARQTRERFAKRLGVPLEDIGLIQGGEWLYGDSGVYVAVIDTLIQDKFKGLRKLIYDNCELLFIDEAHHSPSSKYYQTLMYCKARYRFGLTGTPVGRSDGADLKLRACTGSIIARIGSKELIEKGILARPTVFFTQINKPKILADSMPWAGVYAQAIVNNDLRNSIIVNYALELEKLGKRTLILVKEIDHGETIKFMLRDGGSSCAFVHGSCADDVIDTATRRLESGKLRTLIATSIFDEGVDIPAVNAILLATGGKSQIAMLQRIGRGLRRKKDDNRVFIFDFFDTTHKHLINHAEQRVGICKREGFKVVLLKKAGHIASLVA